MKWAKMKLAKWLGVDVAISDAKCAKESALAARTRVINHINELEHFTKLDVDASYRGNCTVILTGIYRGRAYVQFYDLSPDHFKEYVERLKYERGDNVVRHVDAPIGFSGHFGIG